MEGNSSETKQESLVGWLFESIGGTRLVFLAWLVADLLVFQAIVYFLMGTISVLGFAVVPIQNPLLLVAYLAWVAIWSLFYEFAKKGGAKQTATDVTFWIGMLGWLALDVTLMTKPLFAY